MYVCMVDSMVMDVCMHDCWYVYGCMYAWFMSCVWMYACMIYDMFMDACMHVSVMFMDVCMHDLCYVYGCMYA